MRQVPSYVIVGNGALAQHFCQYLRQLELLYKQWSRSAHTLEQLHSMLKDSTHVLLLISDDAIDAFIQSHLVHVSNHVILVHCSGCLVSEYAFGAHPLQSFKRGEHYTLDEYQQIPFALDETAPAFSSILPGLQNPHYRIALKGKQYYHAMCVLANNVTTLLWQKLFKELTSRFGFQSADLLPLLQKTFQNIQSNPTTALTGPFARGDVHTLNQDLDALSDDPFYELFKSVMQQFKVGELNEVS